MKNTIIGVLIGLLCSTLIFTGLYLTNIITFSKQNNTDTVDKINSDDTSLKYQEYLKNKKENLKEILTTVEDSEYSVSGNSMLHEEDFEISLTSELKLILNIESLEKYNNYTIDNNVIDFFLVSVGNGGFKYIYYLTENGTLKSLCIDTIWENEFEIKTLEEKNVISVKEILGNNAHLAVITDINGETKIIED
ncbi:MAG: hypothetical protein Q4C33_03775 [bacterium]|nr:hypothetical protein [bacterium]